MNAKPLLCGNASPVARPPFDKEKTMNNLPMLQIVLLLVIVVVVIMIARKLK